MANARVERDRRDLEQRLATLAPACAYKTLLLAQRLGMSERHLRRVIRATLGISPGEWLRRRRLRAALQLLMDAQSVKEVALVLGFQEMSQFSRDFKRQFGCTPSTVLGAVDKLEVLTRLAVQCEQAG